MLSASMFEWYEGPALLVLLSWWFGVGLLVFCVGVLLFVAVNSHRARDKVCAGIAACFLLVEAGVLSYIYMQVNTPHWFEALFVFNGFALPVQLILVAGVAFTSGLARSRWLVGGTAPALAAVPIFAATAISAFRQGDI